MYILNRRRVVCAAVCESLLSFLCHVPERLGRMPVALESVCESELGVERADARAREEVCERSVHIRVWVCTVEGRCVLRHKVMSAAVSVRGTSRVHIR